MANNYLSTGSRGKDVRELQVQLNENGFDLDVDGVYGPKTQSAVKAYQKKNGLKVDGLAGVETMGSLQGNGKKPTGGNGIDKSKKPEFKDESGTGGSDPDTGGNIPPVVNNTPPTGGNAAGNVGAGSNSFTYDPFQPSQTTQEADAKRQELAGQKPGDFSYSAYAPSETVLQANALLQQQLANKPGEYISQYASQIQAIMDQYLNRDKFSYDLNSDALYKQYADQYQLMGQQAMMDTMGQAQAMTGGYGNSYAQSVGQQAYQGYLQKLNEVVPELYQMAYDRYNQEGQDMLNQYGLLAGQDELEYGRYRDQVSDYYTELSRLTEDARYKADDDYGKYFDQYKMAYSQHRDSVSDWQSELNRADSEYWNQYSADYGQYSDDRNLEYDSYWNEKDMAYQQERDQASDEKWNKEFAYQQERDKVSDQRYESEQAAKAAAAAAKASETKYTEFTYEEQAKWDKEFQKADSLSSVERIADRMAQAGIDPQIVAQWYDHYAEKFMDKEPEPAPKPPLKTGGGGGGAGTMYIDFK
jgi:peptidoglycan hydrolase-like protein with peptidoglycan-binding domain